MTNCLKTKVETETETETGIEIESYPFQTMVLKCKSIMDHVSVSQKLDSVWQELDGYFACAQFGEHVPTHEFVISKTMNFEWQKVSQDLISQQYTQYALFGNNSSSLQIKENVKAPTQVREYQVNQFLLQEMAARKYIEIALDYLKKLGHDI